MDIKKLLSYFSLPCQLLFWNLITACVGRGVSMRRGREQPVREQEMQQVWRLLPFRQSSLLQLWEKDTCLCGGRKPQPFACLWSGKEFEQGKNSLVKQETAAWILGMDAVPLPRLCQRREAETFCERCIPGAAVCIKKAGQLPSTH